MPVISTPFAALRSTAPTPPVISVIRTLRRV
jgi:hypothetical protein